MIKSQSSKFLKLVKISVLVKGLYYNIHVTEGNLKNYAIEKYFIWLPCSLLSY